MEGIFIELVARCQFHHLAEIHHPHARGDVAHHAEIVRDEQVGQPQILAQLFQQIDDLRLDRDIERRDRLVADDEIRRGGEGPRDADALTLPTGKFVRIAVTEGQR